VGNPINLVTPVRANALAATKKVGVAISETTTTEAATGKKGAPTKTSTNTKGDNTTRKVGVGAGVEAIPETPYEKPELAARKEDGSPTEAMGMPGQWESSPNISLDPTPVQGLTSPRRDLTPGTIGVVRDELTIGFIANEVPMEPELSPEPEEARPKTTETIRYGKEQEEEMLRRVAEDSKRQGEADHEREEGEMLGRVLKKAREREEPKKQEKKGEVELGRKPKSEEEGRGRGELELELGYATSARIPKKRPEGRESRETARGRR